jgi:hypothetical protein
VPAPQFPPLRGDPDVDIRVDDIVQLVDSVAHPRASYFDT